MNAQRTVERAFEDAAEERRVLAEAADEADAVKSSLERSVAELDAKHADADARAAVLDEVTALHQQWEREQEERERVARDTVEVAEAAERSATEQTARAKVELAAMERARRAFEASEAALDERERKLAHTWRTIRGDAHRISEASYRASIGAQRSRGRILAAKAEMSREFAATSPGLFRTRRSRLRPRPAATSRPRPPLARRSSRPSTPACPRSPLP